MPNQKRQTCLPEKTAKGGSVIMPPDSQPDSKKYNGLIDKDFIKQEEDSDESKERGPSLGPQEEEDRGKEKETSDAADVKTEPASEGSGEGTGENQAKEAEEQRILEVLRVADELDNCLDGIRKEQSETEQRLGLADDSKEVSQLTQKRTAFVHLAHLIRKRMKELKEDCWKAIGEKSEGEEAFGALFKKMGKLREEATKEIQGLKQHRRTAKINKKIVDYERRINRLQKADDTLLYDLRILAIGCQQKLENIKEGGAAVVKTEVKEEPESPNQDPVIPAAFDVSHLEEDTSIVKEEVVEEEMVNDDTEMQNQAAFSNQRHILKFLELFDQVDYFPGIVDDDSIDYVDMEERDISSKKGKKRKVETMVEEKMKESVEEETEMEEEPVSSNQEPLNKRGRPPVLANKSKGKKKETSEGKGKEERQMNEPKRRRSTRHFKPIAYFEEKGKEERDASLEEGEEESSGSDGDEEWNEKTKTRMRVFGSDEDASDGRSRGGMVASEDEAVLIKKDSKKKKRGPLASPIENKRKESAAGGQREEERENEEEDDMLGGLGGFDESDDNEPTPVKDSVVKKPLGRDASISGNEEEQDDMDMEDSADNNESGKEDQEERVCPVDGCSKKSLSDEAHKKHMLIHPHPLICGVCKRPWPSAAGLREHHRVHSGAKPFQCPTCEIKFARVGTLKKHIRQHTRERPYGCDLCEKNFTDSSGLKYHQRTHNQNTMFPCSICDYRSGSTGHLKRHMQTHTGEKPFKCSDCDGCFSRKEDLKRHKASVHMGQMPFKCSDCGRCFSRKDHLE